MEETLQIFEYLVGKSLHYPYSIKVVNRLTGEIVAFRTMSIGHRDSSLDWEPFPLDVDSFSKNMNLLGDVLNDCKENFWNSVDPSVTKVLRREISSVVKRHQRKGIAKAMLELGLDFTDLKVLLFPLKNKWITVGQGNTGNNLRSHVPGQSDPPGDEWL